MNFAEFFFSKKYREIFPNTQRKISKRSSIFLEEKENPRNLLSNLPSNLPSCHHEIYRHVIMKFTVMSSCQRYLGYLKYGPPGHSGGLPVEGMRGGTLADGRADLEPVVTGEISVTFWITPKCGNISA
jgi:hypothetical protein